MKSYDELSPKQRVVLDLLEQAGERGVTTGEFCAAFIERFSARIKELRNNGYAIESKRLGQSSWRYELISEPEGKESYGTGSGDVPTQEPMTSPDALFDSLKTSKTRSAVTGEWIPDEAA